MKDTIFYFCTIYNIYIEIYNIIVLVNNVFMLCVHILTLCFVYNIDTIEALVKWVESVGWRV